MYKAKSLNAKDLPKPKLFNIQELPDGTIAPDSASFIDALKQDEWLHGECRYAYKITPVPYELTQPDKIIPIGSVEFIQEALRFFRLPPLRAVNIPPELDDMKYKRRKVWRLHNKVELQTLVMEIGTDLLVKPAGSPKSFDTITTRYMREVPDKEPLFASELLADITAEWRVFVLRGRILDIRPYMLHNWVCPDRNLVEEMARKVSLPACTIDTAVLETGETVLLEVHPFLACGLYGFDGPDILRMASTAWTHQIQEQ